MQRAALWIAIQAFSLPCTAAAVACAWLGASHALPSTAHLLACMLGCQVLMLTVRAQSSTHEAQPQISLLPQAPAVHGPAEPVPEQGMSMGPTMIL